MAGALRSPVPALLRIHQRLVRVQQALTRSLALGSLAAISRCIGAASSAEGSLSDPIALRSNQTLRSAAPRSAPESIIATVRWHEAV
jgi:hypothetical protein